MSTRDGDPIDPSTARAFPAADATPGPHADYHRQAAEHFRSARPGPPGPVPAAEPIAGQTLFDLHPWQAAAAVGALCLLIALFAEQSFSWIVLALLCAAAASYLKTRDTAWPPAVRDALVRQRLANPAPSSGAAQYPTSPPPASAPQRSTPTNGPAYGSAAPPSSSSAPAAAGPAMAAAVLALVIGIYWLWQTYDLWHTVVGFSGPNATGAGGLRATFIVEALVSTAVNVALIVGGGQLLNRNSRARGWIAFGCLIVLADAIVTWVKLEGTFNLTLARVPSVVATRLLATVIRSQDDLKVWMLIGTVVPLLTLILAWSTATQRWCGQTASSSRSGLVAAGIAAAAVIIVIAVVGGQREQTVASGPMTTTAPTTSVVADPTELAIKNASVGDCIDRVVGPAEGNGISSVTVTAVSCASSAATDVVTAITDNTGACGPEWVRATAFGRTIVLCLRKM